MKTYKDYGINIPEDSQGQITTVCPECSHKRKKTKDRCLSINADEGIWNCHHCNWSGSLNAKRDFEIRRETKADYTKPKWISASGLPEKVIKYFNGRGISKATLEKNDIQYQEGVYFSGKKLGAICFPLKRGGDTINIKYRSGAKNFTQETGAEKILYGLDDIDGDVLIVCEGEIDKLSFDEVGYSFAVSVPEGAPPPGTQNYASKFSFLENCKKELSGVKEFILAVDNDAAGQTLEYELARRLGFDKCLRVAYPEGCKDANDVLVKHGAEALKKVVGSAKPFPIAGVIKVSDIEDEVYALFDHGLEKVYSTGWTNVDEYYKVRPGEMNIVTGFPGDGKSEFLDALLLNLANQYGWQFGVCSLENLPHSRHTAKLVKKHIGMPFYDGVSPTMTRAQLTESMAYINEHFHFIVPEEVTIENILKSTKSLIYREGIKGLVVDPYNMLVHKRQSGISETEYIAQFLAKVRLFARDNDIAVWIVAHPAKVTKDERAIAPGLYSISGSAHWANMADNGFSVFRPEAGGVEIAVKKIRFEEVGQRGSAFLEYEAKSGRYK